MRRDFESLRRGPFDLLVVGGGIYGSWIAYDAALRGLRVALVERTDWAAGTSSSSSKLIHGGLRYLERLHFGLVRTSLAERRRLARLAPHRIHPLRFLVPIYRGGRLGRWRLKLGLVLYDWLAGGDQPVDAHRSLSRAEILERASYLAAEGLRGGFSYGDCSMDDARYVLEVVDGAVEAGAAAVNRAEVVRLLITGGRVRGALVRDVENDIEIEVPATVTVDCSGAWSAEVEPESDRSRAMARLTKGVHLVMPRLGHDALLLTVPSDGRVFFLIPWYGRTLLGTTDTDFGSDPDELRVTPTDIDYLLVAANRYLAGTGWSESDILGSYVGLRVLRNERGATPSEISREWSLEQPMPGLLTPVGGKYTSARADAALAVDQVLALVGRPATPCPTRDRPFPWAPRGDFETWLEHAVVEGRTLGLDGETARWAALRYGTRLEDLHRLLRDHHDLGARIHPELPFCRGEIVHAVHHEMARGLEDVVRRRIPLTLLAPPDADRLAAISDLVGDLLGWPDERKGEEVSELLLHLGRLGAPQRAAERENAAPSRPRPSAGVD